MFLSDEKIENLFKIMTKKVDKNGNGFTPLGFQKKIIHAQLNEGRNVILHAPTGAGKTLAALAPFYISKYLCKEIDFPGQSIYVLPMRTLAYSLADEARDMSYLWKIKVQTGEVQEDPFFIEGDVIFTTIDQALSGALTIPLSLPFRLANINAGVWAGSYLIFDEFHLLDPNRSFQTTVHLLKQLCADMKLTRFTIMTATLSRELREILAKELNAEHIKVTKKDLLQIKSQYKKKRKVITHASCLCANEILEKHRYKTIVIVNQVDRAITIYKEILKNQPIDTEVFLLHSQLLSDERKSIENKLKEYFGKNRNNKKTILIATQVIEVGIDITSDVMLTEISSAESFLQRIGRNARFEGEEGTVHVYSLNKNDSNRPWLPYEKDEITEAEIYLQNACGAYFDYSKSNEMINNLYSLKDKGLWQKVKLEKKNHEGIMAEAFQNHNKALSGKLIRNIESVSIIIHDHPPEDENIYLFETVSFPLGKMKGFVANLEKTATKFQGMIRRIVYEEDKLLFKNIENVNDVHNLDYIIIHPSMASYEENIGLMLGEPSLNKSYRFPAKNNEKILKRYSYKMDTFEEHIHACLLAYKQICFPKCEYTINRFGELFKLTKVNMNRIIDFVIVMHDTGKLSKKWQSIAMDIQLQAIADFNNETLLAHTDNPSGKRVGFPNHSVLGAVIAYFLFKTNEKYYEISHSVLTSIAHHHSSNAVTLDLQKHFKGIGILQKLLREIDWHFTTEELKQIIETSLKKIEHKKDWTNQWVYWHVDPVLYWLYLFLVRQLRISDQRSFDFIEEVTTNR
ncbi:CRISPR-associated helicase/endonuclease Cas3 [Neobacillus fumarioli]|uniref:CRISPR-associated helicase/endonuclease Cas3 n=1 Tax=Neobacillus fumarioli TaxID=105229 RepID=UPI00082DA8E4|nr:CRISPR-associated helicase/endonuclease Cas3 [Neobacillus fumarioli]